MVVKKPGLRRTRQLAKPPNMEIANYLACHGISYAEFARRIGTPHARTVERYAKNQRVPSGRMMAAIIAATDGVVQAADFFPPILPGAKSASEEI